MGLIENVALRAGVELIRRGSSFFIPYMGVLDFLDSCAAEGVRVLGIEGFVIREGSVVPCMDSIADFSEIKLQSDSITESKQFIHLIERGFCDNLVFEFCLSEG